MFSTIGVITILLLDLVLTLSLDEIDVGELTDFTFVLNGLFGITIIITGIIINSYIVLIGIYLIFIFFLMIREITFYSIKEYFEERKKNE